MDTTFAAAADHPVDPTAAVVWIDRRHALVAKSQAGRREVREVAREVDLDAQYLLRVAHETADCERILIMGSDDQRLAFEREYVALYRRPDRLVDSAAEIEPEPPRLVDRLRFLEFRLG